jgi:prepilin-type N-terminal cleavage/methylation domain-containing protein
MRGFTLIELMVTLAVLAVLVAIGTPAMADVIRNNRRTVLVNELLASLMLARANAARSGQPMVVCGVTDANANGAIDVAERSCTGVDWRTGWMIAAWNDADADSTLDAGELLAPTRVYLNDDEGYTIMASDFAGSPATGAAALMPFNREGTSGRLTVCDPRGAARSRAVDFSSSGRPTVVVNESEDSAGVALTCP